MGEIALDPGAPRVGEGKKAVRTRVSDGRLELALPAFVLAVAAAHLARVLALGVGPDTWLAILGGHQIVAHGLPSHESLTLLGHGRPWVDQQWFGELIAYGGYSLGGLAVLKLGNAALLLLALGLTLAVALRRSRSAVAVAGVGLLGELVLFDRATIRAETLAQLLYVALLALVLADARRPSRRILWTIPLLVVWANVHGSVVVGVAIVTCVGLLEIRRGAYRRGVVLLLASPLSLLTSPYATGLPGYYRSTLANPAFERWLSEWQAPTLSTEPLTYLLVIATVVLLARRWRDLLPIERLILCITVPLALSTVRSVPWLAYPAMMILPAAVTAERVLARYRMARPLVTLVGVVTIAMTLFAGVSAIQGGVPSHAYTATDATVVAHELDRGRWKRVIATDYVADWLLLKVPAARGHVLFDVRYELLSGKQLDQVSKFWLAFGPRFASFLRPGDLLVVDPSRGGLLKLVEHCPGMRVLYRGRSLTTVGIRSTACGPALANTRLPT